jgi:hypothetical protein
MNVNEIIYKISEVALSQEPVKSVYNGDVYENWNSAEVNYGSFNIGLQNVTYQGNFCIYTFVLYYGDRLGQDKKNLNSIITDGVNTIQSVVNILNQLDMDIPEQINYTPFEQKFMDYLAGVYATVEITTESTLGLCSIDNYEYTDDKDKLIERLIEEINKYKAKDEELALLLQEILHKVGGEGIN